VNPKARRTTAVTPSAASGALEGPKGSRRASRRSGEELTNFSPDPAVESGLPTRSRTQPIEGAKEKLVMRTIGIDLGARKVVMCELVDCKAKLRTCRSVQDLSDCLGPNTPKARILVEACREAWHVHDLLVSWGHEVLVLDSTRAKEVGVGRHGRKNDELDAEVLARALQRGHVPQAHVLSPHRRELRKQIGVRRALVESRSQMASTLRGLVRAEGYKIKGCAPEDLPAAVSKASMPESLRMVIQPLIVNVLLLTRQIAQVDLVLSNLCEREPVVQLLATKKGVSLIVAASFVSVIDDAKRFKNAQQVASYLGLVPCEDTTGGRRKLGAITKQGNSYLRSLLVEAAWPILRQVDPNDPLCQWAKQLARKNKRLAAVALARRLAVILWAMWRDGTVYDPIELARRQSRGQLKRAQDALQQAQALQQSAKKLAARDRQSKKLLERKCSLGEATLGA
jgi:transposase